MKLLFRVSIQCICRFGGILLHADRFKHINNVARILLLESGVGEKVELYLYMYT